MLDSKSRKVERPVLRYFGGKFLLAPWIIENFPQHRTYVEPFGGGASVLMRKAPAYSEVYNDLDDEVVNVFTVLRCKGKRLTRALELTPFSRREFEKSYRLAKGPVERARRTIVRSFMGFGSNSVNREAMTGFRSNSSRSGTTPAHDWKNFPENLSTFIERLSGVVIENRDYRETMLQHDSPETLHFVDPPYVQSTRSEKHGYRHEFTNEDHEALLDFLKFSIQGMVVLCGYDNALYRARLDWETRMRETRMRETHADGARDRTEVLWLNPAAVKAQSQQSLFGAPA